VPESPPASAAWTCRSSKAKSQDSPPPITPPMRESDSADERNTGASPAISTAHFVCGPSCEICPRQRHSSAAVKTFPFHACRRTPHGVLPNCTRAAAWGHVKEESAVRPQNFFLNGALTQFARQYFPRGSRAWLPSPIKRNTRYPMEAFDELEWRHARNYNQLQQ